MGMRHTFRFNTRSVARVDLHLLLAIVMLTIFGLVMILSASGYICATSKIYKYDMFYLAYDTNSRTFSDRIRVNDDVIKSRSYGINKDILILYEEGALFKYYPLKDEIEPLAQVEENEGICDVLAIDDERFLVYFWNAMDDNCPFDGVYIYTLVNE
jgi:hypothetical protein